MLHIDPQRSIDNARPEDAWRRFPDGMRSFRARLRQHGPTARRLAFRALLVLAAIPLTVAFLFLRYIHADRSDLPDIAPLLRFEPPTTGQVYDARGEVLLELAREYRWVVKYDEIPVVVREAVLAAEDRNFFTHSGVDFRVWPRVASRIAAGSLAASRREQRRTGSWRLVLLFPQGGSTVTQQLVRAYYLSDLTRREGGDALVEPTLMRRGLAALVGARATNKLCRKLEEMRLALWVEEEFRQRYGSREQAKREILSRYASFIYLGNGRYGFAAASEYYFGRPLDSFQPWDADKAAVLAGIAKSPRDYAPSPSNLDRPRRRRNAILGLMVKRGFISPELGAHCIASPLRLAPAVAARNEAPAVVRHAVREMEAAARGSHGLTQLAEGRVQIHTTVDNRIQEIVNDALERGLALYEARHPASRGLVQGAVVVLHNQDARVLAEAGGRRVYRNRPASYADFNRVIDSYRQAGSALKPFVYLAALTHGAGLDSEVDDEPVAVPMGGGRPAKWISNYDGRFKGPIPIRLALAESRNCATMRITLRVGLADVLQQAHAMGIRSRLQPHVTTALGASEVNLLELANAYRSLASGVVAQPQVVERVTDAGARRVLYARQPQVRPLALPPAALRAIQEGLRSVVRLPTGTAHALDAASFPIPVMGKTGTTNDFRDALFVGSTYGPRGITVAVRIGFDDNRWLGDKETGGRAALPIFREIMLRVYRDRLAGSVPQFPMQIEEGIDRYLRATAAPAEPRPGMIAAVPALVAPLVVPLEIEVRPASFDPSPAPSPGPAQR